MNLRNFRNEARDDYLEAILMITQEKGHCRFRCRQLQVHKQYPRVARGRGDLHARDGKQS